MNKQNYLNWLQDLLITNSVYCIETKTRRLAKNGKYLSREICELKYGESPTLYHQALHTCDNGRCINPNHIYWGTMKQNGEDRARIYKITKNEVERDEYSF